MRVVVVARIGIADARSLLYPAGFKTDDDIARALGVEGVLQLQHGAIGESGGAQRGSGNCICNTRKLQHKLTHNILKLV